MLQFLRSQVPQSLHWLIAILSSYSTSLPLHAQSDIGTFDSRILVSSLALIAQAVVADDVHDVAPAMPIGNGSMAVFRKTGDVPGTVLIHFHGATSTVKEAFARSDWNAVLVIINFPGLSSAYSKPFSEDRELFEHILEQTYSAATAKTSGGWKHIYVSSFSAGYGAVREILKTPAYFEQIDGIIMADSIYAGLNTQELKRVADDENMRDFVQFASLAAMNKKAFVLSHSAQPTSYASTTETADYLLNSLNMTRMPNTSLSTGTLRQTSRAQRGQFVVLGFDGVSGQEHMQHLNHIDTFWGQLPGRK